MNNEFTTKIGLEIHVQLKTKAKMFCGCDNNAQKKDANTVVCPICMGMPGTLPVANKSAIEMTVKTGLALGCEIPEVSRFDRKHYFYPDLPKGYQISQYDMPFCKGGSLTVGDKKVRLNRIHLEEDAGKLIHPEESNYSIVDLNRAGTPLMEIVTEPDIESPLEAKEFLRELQIILRSLEVSDADMEKGHLRCDANISVSRQLSVADRRTTNDKRQTNMSEIVEIKNLNSFKFVEKALLFEQKRLADEYPGWPGKETKVTRGFDSKNIQTYVQREKEEAKDYRYFPEPDVPPFELTRGGFNLEKLRKELPSLPHQSRAKYLENKVGEQEIDIIIKNHQLKKLFDEVVELDGSVAPNAARLIVNEPTARERGAEFIVKLAKEIKEKSLPSNIVREIIKSGKLETDFSPEADEEKIQGFVARAIDENPGATKKIIAGKDQVVGFLVGEAMRMAQGKVDPNKIRKEILKEIDRRKNGSR